MLLVMDSAQVFTSSDGYLPLWHITWERINRLLPKLKDEVFKALSAVPKPDETVSPSKPDDPVSAPPDSPVKIDPAKSSSPPLPNSNHQTASRGTSIILQPPSSYGHSFTTPILNHLGHQVGEFWFVNKKMTSSAFCF